MNNQAFSPPSKEQIMEWSNKIIKENRLTDSSMFNDIIMSITYFFEKIYKDYRVAKITDEKSNVSFYVSKREEKISKEDSMFDFLLGPDTSKPMNEKEKLVAKSISLTLSEILLKLDIINPDDYPRLLKDLGMNKLAKLPDFREETFDFWADKIINHFKLTSNSDVIFVQKKIILFFDLIFEKYSTHYRKFKDEKIFPVHIDRIDDDSLAWATEIAKIRNMIYSTYYLALSKLNRSTDFPKDPDFWFDLALIYETMGNSGKASEYGERGLSLNPTELGSLSNLALFYAEHNKFHQGLKYLKKLGEIFINKGFFKQSLSLWQRIVSSEPNVKDNWLKLALVLDKLGNASQAEQCRLRASQL
ncbi:MAG: hypothetical protein EAX90_12070 [Candidatus Heimdallarchaeota archaeon]|nr:hypothetical protein [Candidatus Heimdallarchaeota archaeon]